MAALPSPLQVGSPNTTRRISVDAVPTALRAGSPAIESHTRPPLARKNTSGASDRLSQLFPSRPSSVASITPLSSAGHSRRTSLPLPLTPAAEPSYRIPRAPAPPSFAEDTSYNASASAFDHQGASQSLDSSSGKRRLLNRLSSLKGGSSKGVKYNKLEDEDEVVGYDLSGFEGLPMKKFTPQKKLASASAGREQEQDLNEAGYAAEFERLEAQLGSGMSSIVEKPFTHNPSASLQPNRTGHKRGLSGSEVVSVQALEAQKEAEKTERIVAVADIPVDISDFHAGSDFDTRSIMTADTGLAKNEAETSYFFPEGKPIRDYYRCSALSFYRSRAAFMAAIYYGSTVAVDAHYHSVSPSWSARVFVPTVSEAH
jgi:hypothetical protein